MKFIGIVLVVLWVLSVNAKPGKIKQYKTIIYGIGK